MLFVNGLGMAGQSYQKYKHRLCLCSSWFDKTIQTTLTQRKLTHGVMGIGPLPRHKKYFLKRSSGVEEGRVRANQIINKMNHLSGKQK
jgi:hypothetical protein